MNIIVAGGRDFDDYDYMCERLDYYFQNINPTIVSGMAEGADSLAVRYAHDSGLELIAMPADWKRYGKSAGFKRNAEMEKIADALVAFWDGKSVGTKHMIDTMRKAGKPVKIVRYERK